MYKLALYISFLLVEFHTWTQNLVMNPSFEEYWMCPDDAVQVDRCKYVFNPQCFEEPVLCKSTSDYYNSCAPIGNTVNVPYTANGIQEASSGNGFLGIVSCIGEPNWREYIQIKLDNQLSNNNVYNFSFHINLADYSQLSTDAIGVKFVEDSIRYTSQFLYEFMTPDWENEIGNFIEDTVNWIKLSGEFVAKGNEQWIIIGIFTPDSIFSNKIFNIAGALGECCYYFIDDVEVTIKPFHSPNVFTPNNDGTNDIWFTNGSIKEATIFNRWGDVVFRSTQGFSGWDGNTQSGIPCSEGVYFFVLLEEHPIAKTETKHSGFITLLR